MASKNNANSLASSFELKSGHDLYNCLQVPHNLIVVDARSGPEYKSQSVRTAINIDWKISEKNSLKRLKEYSGPGKKFSLRKYFKLFIYDECEFTACSEGDSPAWRLIDALMEEGTCKTPIYLLEEGFDRFRSKYSYLVHGHPALIQDVLPSEILEGRLYLVILYLMQECDMTLKQAYDFVKRKRATINPNPKFLKQLGEFELKLRGASTIRFREKGPITISTIYDWLIGAEWIPRVVITKPN